MGDTCEHVVVSKSGCGAVLTSVSGTVESSQFSKGYYPNDEDCYWLIQGPPSSKIGVTFHSFDVDDEGDCQWCTCDYLEAKVYGFEKVGQRFCGSYVRPIHHNFSSLLLHFHADDTWSMNSGLKFSYHIIQM
ncbi:dorsal-ventral patterning tolloid-like protein 1 [Gigantopelta aegis]|uniref:dorsal-ventral patterning tolloid-like protein 1 n=1 Tax=Gigantopelta aegis TaxID=1735272 RepID=UPI001B88CDFD|nr:dorsal-ventral patterning tolloid-like protein 1 [Gigantopelta aegis]